MDILHISVIFFTVLYINGVHSEITSATFSVKGTIPNLPNTSGVTVRVSPGRTENYIDMICTFNEPPTTANVGSLTFSQGRNPGTNIYQLRIAPKVETIFFDPFKTPQRIKPPAQHFEGFSSKIQVNILLTDQNDYRCQVIKQDFTSVAAKYVKINVVGLPGRPTLSANPGPLIAGQKLTLTCSANVGKPKGQLTWYRQSASAGSRTVVTKNATVQDITNADGSFTVTETVIVDAMSYLDNGAKYTCEAKNAALTPSEERLKTTLTLDVKYQVRDIKVSNTAQPHYPGRVFTCTADGNPAANITWTKVNGTQDLQTNGATLTIPDGATVESLFYKCTASNTVTSSQVQIDYVLNVNITAVPDPGPVKGATVNAGLIGGLIGGVAALIIIIIVVVIICKKRKAKEVENVEKGEQFKGETNNANNIPMGGYDVDMDDNFNPAEDPKKKNLEGLVYADLNFDDRPRSRKPIQIQEDFDRTDYADIRRV